MEYLLEEEGRKKQDQEEFFRIIPDILKKEVLVDLNGKLVAQDPIFSHNFSFKLLMDLAIKLKEKTFSPDEDIYNGADPEDSFYIIAKGQIELYLSRTNHSIRVLIAGEHFGHIPFFSKKKRIMSAMSVFYSNVCYLEKKVFLKQLEVSPNDKEAYCYIKDKVDLYNEYSVLHQECLGCGKQNHIIIECPQLQYIPDMKEIIREVAEEDKRFRKNFSRKRQKCFNALQDLAIIGDKVRHVHDFSFKSLSANSILKENSFTETFYPKNTINEIAEHLDLPTSKERIHGKSFSDKGLKYKEIEKESIQERDMTGSPAVKFSTYRLMEDIELDKVKSFNRYFPHNNVENVIKRINRLNDVKRLPLVSNSRKRFSLFRSTLTKPAEFLPNKIPKSLMTLSTFSKRGKSKEENSIEEKRRGSRLTVGLGGSTDTEN